MVKLPENIADFQKFFAPPVSIDGTTLSYKPGITYSGRIYLWWPSLKTGGEHHRHYLDNIAHQLFSLIKKSPKPLTLEEKKTAGRTCFNVDKTARKRNEIIKTQNIFKRVILAIRDFFSPFIPKATPAQTPYIQILNYYDWGSSAPSSPLKSCILPED